MTDETPDPLAARQVTLPVGVVLRRQPGVTRWARWVWRAVAVLPGAGPADWHEMRRDGEAAEYHAATVDLALHRTEVEAYRVALSTTPPSVYVILRPAEEPDAPHDITVFGVTASAFEAQDYLDSGEEIVEPVAMPPELIAWVSAYVEAHLREEAFVKRQRRNWTDGEAGAGRGDPRVQRRDVFRAPGRGRKGVLH